MAPVKSQQPFKDQLVIGQFGKTHGIHGWIRVHSFTHPPDNIVLYSHWRCQTKQGLAPIELDAHQFHAGQLLVKLTNYDTPETVRIFTNRLIVIDRAQLPALASDEFYWHDLEGLTVINHDGSVLGIVAQIIATGANDVLIVKGEQELWLPYTKQMIERVDLTTGNIYVRWEGYA